MSWNRRDMLVGAAGLTGTALLPGTARAHPLAEISGQAFGTSWRILIPARLNHINLGRDIGRLLQSLDSVLSPFRTNSELARFNASNSAMRLSSSLADVVQEGLRIARLTSGAFDPTVGPSVANYGFGPIRNDSTWRGPSAAYRGLDVSGAMASKMHPGLTFDPCGIGKGYALDRVGRLLSNSLVDAYLAEFGGEVLVRGNHPTGRSWRVGIEQPAPGSVRLRHVVAMSGGALATSGDRTNAYVVGGRRYSHIVDPRTAAPVNNGVASVSVIAQSAMTADALATALMVMGPTKGMAFAKRASQPVLFVMHDGEGYRDLANAAFRAGMMAKEKEKSP